MLSKAELESYRVEESQVFTIDKIVQTPLGLESHPKALVGVVHEVQPFVKTVHHDNGYKEYTQYYSMLVGADIIPFELVVFYDPKEPGGVWCENRTSSIQSEIDALYRKYGACIFKPRRIR